MRRLATVPALLRRAKAFEALKTQAAAFSSRASHEAANNAKSSAALGLIGALVGGGAITYTFSSQQCVAQAEAATPVAAAAAASQEEENRYAPPKELKGHLPKEIILYQYEACPFCCKVKAFLDYHNIPYRCVEVNPLTKAELKWSEYRKVPVVMIDGEQVNDSSVIISRLNAEIEQQQKAAGAAGFAGGAGGSESGGGGWLSRLFGSGGGQPAAGEKGAGSSCCAGKKLEEEEKWRRWVDDWFVKVITVNIYRNASESFQTFDYITQQGNFKFWEREAARIVGATMMWGISGKLKKKYNVEGDVRDNLYQAAGEWVGAVGDRKFLGGEKPNMADLSMFGVIRALSLPLGPCLALQLSALTAMMFAISSYDHPCGHGDKHLPRPHAQHQDRALVRAHDGGGKGLGALAQLRQQQQRRCGGSGRLQVCEKAAAATAGGVSMPSRGRFGMPKLGRAAGSGSSGRRCSSSSTIVYLQGYGLQAVAIWRDLVAQGNSGGGCGGGSSAAAAAAAAEAKVCRAVDARGWQIWRASAKAEGSNCGGSDTSLQCNWRYALVD